MESSTMEFRKLLKSRLKKPLISPIDDTPMEESDIVHLLNSYFQIRQLPYFFKTLIPCIVETKAMDVIDSNLLLRMDSIFVDVSFSQTTAIVAFVLETLDKLISSIAMDESKINVKLCLILRSIAFASPGILQNPEKAKQLIMDICERLKSSGTVANEYRRLIDDLLSEIIVKLYLAASMYDEIDLGVDQLESLLPRKSLGLPWKVLLDSHTVKPAKFRRLIAKFIDTTPDHDCTTAESDGFPCLGGYCHVVDFWTRLLSNFALFRCCVDQGTLEKITAFVAQHRAEWESNPILKKSISDFMSIFDLDIAQLNTDIGKIDGAIPDVDMVVDEKLAGLRSTVMNALKNGTNLHSLFDVDSITNENELLRHLQTATIAFEYFESAKKVDDSLKSFFTHYSSEIFDLAPYAIVESAKKDVAITARILIPILELLTSMLNEKSLDLVKYPIISVGLNCASLAPWERLNAEHKTDFIELFKLTLKFIRTGTKKCRDVVLNMAPNWMGILRRLQAVLFAMITDMDMDDFTPLFFNLSRFYSTLDRSKESEKIVAYLIHDLVECLKKKKLEENQHEALLAGMYKLIGISDSFSIAMITSLMDDTSKELFRLVHENYSKYHKYAGQV